MRGLPAALPLPLLPVSPPGLPPTDNGLGLLGLPVPPGAGLSLPPLLPGLLQVPPVEPLPDSDTLTAAPSSTLRARVAKSREHLVSATFSDAGLQRQTHTTHPR